MNDFEKLQILGFDYLEFAVADIDKASELYRHMGFERIATREILERKLRSTLFVQGHACVVLSQSADPKDPVAEFVSAHGDGVFNVCFLCKDVVPAIELLAKRGAEILDAPRGFTTDFGKFEIASIETFAPFRISLVSREGSLFAEGFEKEFRRPGGEGYGLAAFDHMTINVGKGKMEEAAKYFEKLFGFKCTRDFDIQTARTGLLSMVMESPNGVLKLPINEPKDQGSQIQEFIDVYHGAGVQHVAINTNHIMDTLRQIRKNRVEFLSVPHTYYEELPKRLDNITENIDDLESLGILADGDDKGYLLQIFTMPVVGPFFYEVIQRKNHDGFGYGNFKALFEAIERDQIERGVLKEKEVAGG